MPKAILVGLYLDPPEQGAGSLGRREEPTIQALGRHSPVMPIKKGRAKQFGTMTQDYKRHGTTTLFAALDVATGKVIGQLHEAALAIRNG